MRSHSLITSSTSMLEKSVTVLPSSTKLNLHASMNNQRLQFSNSTPNNLSCYVSIFLRARAHDQQR